MARYDKGNDLTAHTPGTPKGEERISKEGREPGREDPNHVRTARDSTSINPAGVSPIDPRMPHLPPP